MKGNGGHIEPRSVRERAGERKSTMITAFYIPFSRSDAGGIQLADNTLSIPLNKGDFLSICRWEYLMRITYRDNSRSP